VKKGDYVKKEDVIFDIETTKTSVEIQTDFTGYLNYDFKLDDQLICGDFFYEVSKEIKMKDKKESTKEKKIITKDARKFAEKNNIDIEKCNEQIITKEILLKYKKQTDKSDLNIPDGNDKSILIVGASYHGKSIYDFILQQGKYKPMGFIDYSGIRSVDKIYNNPVFLEEDLEKIYENGTKIIHINTNNINLSREIFLKTKKIGYKIVSIIHPSAVISNNAKIGENVLIGPNAIIGNNVKIGNFTKILNKASVAHDCIIGENVQVSDGATIAGNVTIGENTIIGINSAIINKTKIGSNVLILSGKTVINNIDDNTKY